MQIPLICENDDCSRRGRIIDVMRDIPVSELDLFFENYGDLHDDDCCPVCGTLAVAEDPLEDDVPLAVGDRYFID